MDLSAIITIVVGLVIGLIYIIRKIYINRKLNKKPEPILPVYNSKSYFIYLILAVYGGLTYILVNYFVTEPEVVKQPTSMNIDDVFNKHSGKTGLLDEEQLKLALNELIGYNLSIIESQRYIDSYDTKNKSVTYAGVPTLIGDGKIDLIEFKKIISEIMHDNSSTHILSATVIVICIITIYASFMAE